MLVGVVGPVDPPSAVAGQVGAGLRVTHATLFGALTDEERAGLALGLTGLARALQGGGDAGAGR